MDSEINSEEMRLLQQRYNEYKENPQSSIPWSEVRRKSKSLIKKPSKPADPA
ncbi:MAG: addiction module protein [bacterium]|nr:addiction module protein [bacterium]